MNKKNRYLITSSDPNTWKYDRPVIFLGEWCKDYNLSSFWKQMNYIVALPYGVEKNQRDFDFKKARDIENKLTPILSSELNILHNTNKSTRYWRILFAPWLRRYIEMMINRSNTIIKCLNKYEISGTTYYNDDNYSLACQDSRSAIHSYDDDIWNNILLKKIINKLINKKINCEIIKNKYTGFFLKDKQGFVRKVAYPFFLTLRKIIRAFSSEKNGVYFDAKLNFKEKIKLYFYLKQLPIFWISRILNLNISVNFKNREILSKKMEQLQHADVAEKVIYEMVFDLMPICYLEGYKKLIFLSKKMGLPSNPKFIYTSYAYDYDDLFKVWAADKIEKGKKYLIGQHGNNYGTHRYINPSVEETLADKFLTWGWQDSNPKYLPSFILKTSAYSIKKIQNSNRLLLIQEDVHHRYWTHDHYHTYKKYFKNLKDFVSDLPLTIKDDAVIRIHSSYKNFKFNEYQQWRDFDINLNIEISSEKYWDSIKKSKLVVFSYDTTGILELLSLNIPFIAFWENGTDHLRDSVVIDYNLLKEEGIIHYNTESAIKKINEVWEDIDGWWKNKNLQLVRQKFCNKYARSVSNPAREIKNIILSNS